MKGGYFEELKYFSYFALAVHQASILCVFINSFDA